MDVIPALWDLYAKHVSSLQSIHIWIGHYVNIVSVLSTCVGIGWGREEMRLVRIVKSFSLYVFKLMFLKSIIGYIPWCTFLPGS